MSDPISVRSVVRNYGTPPPSLWSLAQGIGMSRPVSVQDLVGRLQPAQYSVSMPSFRINMMRTGHFGLKTGSDTDYVSMSVKVKGQPISTVTACAGDHSGGEVDVGLSIPNFRVLATDDVYFQYSIINSGGKPSDAVAFLENAASQLLSACEKVDMALISKTAAAAGPLAIPIGALLSALTPQEQGALIGAQLGFAVSEAGLVAIPFGGMILIELGVVIGWLAGWYANDIWGFAFPDCDGVVAAGLYVYNGAQLRQMTKSGTYVQTDKQPGVNSASGCGQNSDYDVTWSLSKQ